MSTQDKADYQWSDEDQSTFVDDLKEDLEDHCDRPMTVGQAIKVLSSRSSIRACSTSTPGSRSRKFRSLGWRHE